MTGWHGSESANFMDADHVEHIRRQKIEASLREFVDAFAEEFGDGESAPREPDESSVYAGVPDGTGFTFGMLRRARAALSM